MADTNRTPNWRVTEIGRRFLRSLAVQAENDSESTINVMDFVARQQIVRLAQAAGIDGANLFD